VWDGHSGTAVVDYSQEIKRFNGFGDKMDVMDVVSLISRWLHIIPAIVLVGGTLFIRFVLYGPFREQGASDNLREDVRKRWSRLVMISILLLLVSGLYNAAMKAIGYELDMLYNSLLLIKIVLSLIIFYLISVLSGRSARAKRFRERDEYWLNIICILMLLVVMIAGYMGKMNFESKVRDQSVMRVPSGPVLNGTREATRFKPTV